jgi:hypothetical protein
MKYLTVTLVAGLLSVTEAINLVQRDVSIPGYPCHAHSSGLSDTFKFKLVFASFFTTSNLAAIFEIAMVLNFAPEFPNPASCRFSSSCSC